MIDIETYQLIHQKIMFSVWSLDRVLRDLFVPVIEMKTKILVVLFIIYLSNQSFRVVCNKDDQISIQPIFLDESKQEQHTSSFNAMRSNINIELSATSMLATKTISFQLLKLNRNFSVPAGVQTLFVNIYGAAGAGNSGGKGGRVQDYISVYPKELLTVTLGSIGSYSNTYYYSQGFYYISGGLYYYSGGYNGGGNAGYSIYYTLGNGGGGFSDISRGSTVLVIAGGGGGEGDTRGGNGGGLLGEDAPLGCNEFPAYGGGQTSGGKHGHCDLCRGFCKLNYMGETWGEGLSGTYHQGGHASYANQGSGGGGGGGHYGGGAGYRSGGGGGSSYSTGSSTVHYQGVNSGDGYVVITYSTCRNGTYIDSFTSATTCKACAALTNSYNGALICCRAGQYVTPGTSVCLSCTAGKYSSAGASACTSCAAGYYSSTVGSTTSTNCKQCTAGRSSLAGSSHCSGCIPGTYQPTAASASCLACPAGRYSTARNASSSLALTCLTCSTGSISLSASTACTACPVGTYTDSAHTYCYSCPSGKYGPTTQATSCLTCPVNSHSSSNSASCTCNDGYSQSNSRTTLTCSICPINTYSPMQTCLPRYTYSLDYSGCYRFFNGVALDWHNASASCSKLSNGNGTLVSITDATENQVVRFLGHSVDEIWMSLNDIAVDGTQKWYGDVSLTYSNWVTDSRIRDYYNSDGLRDCGFMYISSDGLAWNNLYGGSWNNDFCSTKRPYLCESDVQVQYACTDCPYMSTSLRGSSTCTCNAGYRQISSESQLQCEICLPGTYSSTPGSAYCTTCPAGKYSSAGSMECTSCPADYFSFRTGATSLARDCRPCPTGYTALEGSSACTLCSDQPDSKYVTVSSVKQSMTDIWV